MPEIVNATTLAHAVEVLLAGELIGLPTETVYGLAADADNPAAVAKIFAAKGRPADHPLIVHLGASDRLTHYARDIPDAAWALIEAFWPGPLTLILNKASGVSDAITGGQNTIGLRMPGHPLALDLLRFFAEQKTTGGGLAAPSANRFGRISPTTAQHVADELGDAVALILDGGACRVGIESTIVNLSGLPDASPTILRPGAISAAQLALVLQQPVAEKAKASAPRVPGALAAHYAPQTPLQVLDTATLTSIDCDGAAFILRDGSPAAQTLAGQPGVVMLSNQPAAYAHDFYRALRQLDTSDYRMIYVEALPASGEDNDWAALADRLRRAAHQD